MATYTAKQVSIGNGSSDVAINSGALPKYIGKWVPVEINRNYFNEDNTPII